MYYTSQVSFSPWMDDLPILAQPMSFTFLNSDFIIFEQKQKMANVRITILSYFKATFSLFLLKCIFYFC